MATALQDRPNGPQEPHENTTLVDRIHFYVNTGQREKGLALAKIGDFLNECWKWELTY